MFLLLTKQVLLFSSRLFTVEILLKPCKYEFPLRDPLPFSPQMRNKKKERKSWFSENRNKVIVLRLSFTTNTRYSWNLLFLIMCILKQAFCFMGQIICSYNYLLWTIHKKSKFLTFWPTFNQIKSDIFNEQMIWPY